MRLKGSQVKQKLKHLKEACKMEPRIARDYLITIANDEELDASLLSEFLIEHQTLINTRYRRLEDAYMGKYPILDDKPKEPWKPDNRIVVNFAKYIVDTMNGYFMGIPVKVKSSEEDVDDYLKKLNKYNDQDDANAELSKISSIYGKAYERYFVDEYGEISIVYQTPKDAFMIYNDSLMQKPLYYVSYYYDTDGYRHGEVLTDTEILHFNDIGMLHFTDDVNLHGFDGLPAVEYIENEERMSIFEPVYSMMNEYNKALSEKANDVDYFADAYLKILGAELDEDDIKHIRNNRILNFSGADADKIIAEFMDKPNSDTSQENLINRLEKLIYQNSMVANINDENFGTSSGIALKYKLLSMSNLAKTKERKFTAGMNKRYKLIFSSPINQMSAEDWLTLDYKFSQNYPANVAEEAQTAAQLEGIVSKETQLKTLSVVENIGQEMEKMKEENEIDYGVGRISESITGADDD